MTIRWFTDADRQEMRDAQEERRVLDELELRYATEASTEVTAEQIRLVESLAQRVRDRLAADGGG